MSQQTASRAELGYLAVFSIGAYASPPTSPPSVGSWTDILECKSISPSLFTVPVVNVTHLQSPGATEEKRPGLKMPGTVEITGNLVADATQLSININAQNRVTFPFRFYAPIDSESNPQTYYEVTGTAFVASWDPGPFEPSKTSEFKAKFEVAGAFTEQVVTVPV